MTIKTIYVQAKSKAELNRRIEEGHTIVGVEHKMGTETRWPLGEAVPDGTVVKIWNRMSMGSPYVMSYGRWDAKNWRVK
jgi:hypothetical protein